MGLTTSPVIRYECASSTIVIKRAVVDERCPFSSRRRGETRKGREEKKREKKKEEEKKEKEQCHASYPLMLSTVDGGEKGERNAS